MNLENLIDQFMGVSPSGAGPAPGGATGIRDAKDKLTAARRRLDGLTAAESREARPARHRR
jgi:hypothetical protein